MIWRGLFDIFAGVADSQAPSSSTPFEPATVMTALAVRAALMKTGLLHGRDEDMAFVTAAIGDNRYASGIDLRRHGTRLAGDVLRSMGIRASAIVTAEYLAILTPAGRADPIGSAEVLTSAYQMRVAGTNALRRAQQAGMSFVEVIPNNMAAGPCPACLALAGKPIPIAEAPSGPLPGCPHPTQCKLWTRTVLPLD